MAVRNRIGGSMMGQLRVQEEGCDLVACARHYPGPGVSDGLKVMLVAPSA